MKMEVVTHYFRDCIHSFSSPYPDKGTGNICDSRCESLGWRVSVKLQTNPFFHVAECPRKLCYNNKKFTW
jgi:hypothetical protein